MKLGLLNINIDDLEQLPHDVLKRLIQQVATSPLTEPESPKKIPTQLIESINHIIRLREYTDIHIIQPNDSKQIIKQTIDRLLYTIDRDGYVVHIVETSPADCSRECSIAVNHYRVGSIAEIIQLVIDTFDVLPSTDWDKLPVSYKQYEDQYISQKMDCAPLYVSVFDLKTCEFIKPFTMSQYYTCYKQYRKTQKNKNMVVKI
jgi:hypothetical protein